MDTQLSFYSADILGNPAWAWLAFIGIVFALLAFDLGVLHKDDHEIGVRESLPLSAGDSSVALIVGFSAILLSDRRLDCGNAQPR